MGSIASSSDRDLRVIHECLKAAVHGPFFEEWEFATLMGFSRDEIAAIAETWPRTDDTDQQDAAVTNVLNMLLGYPHEYWSRWHEYCPATPREIAQVLARWLGDDGYDETAKGVYDRLR